MDSNDIVCSWVITSHEDPRFNMSGTTKGAIIASLETIDKIIAEQAKKLGVKVPNNIIKDLKWWE